MKALLIKPVRRLLGLRPGAIFSIFTVLILFTSTSLFVVSQQGTTPSVVAGVRSDSPATARRKAPNTAGARTLSRQSEKPQSDWLYVLDSNDLRSESQVLLVDPEQGLIVKRFKAYSNPDMALAPDGRRLYVTSIQWDSNGNSGRSRMEVFDPGSGAVRQSVDNPGHMQSTAPWYPSRMAFSLDGHWLYILKSSDGYSFFLATFDTVRGRFLTDKAPLFGCWAAQFLPLPEDRRLIIIGICPDNYDGRMKVLFLKLTKTGAAASEMGSSNSGVAGSAKTNAESVSELALELHEERERLIVREERAKRRVAFGFFSADHRTLTVVMGGGQIFKIDNQNRTIIQTDVIDRQGRKRTETAAKTNAGNPDDWMSSRWILYQAPTLLPDGTRLYVGINRLSHLHNGSQLFDQIAVFDSETLKLLRTIKTRYAFWSVAMSRDGGRLYAVSPEQACIMVMDAITGQEVKVIYDVGESPIRAIVAP